MRVLYALQATGNGHISRASELIPLLKKEAKVEVMISGFQSDIRPAFDVNIKRRGLSFFHNSQGGIDILKSLKNCQNIRLLKDIKHFPIHKYDIVINDFEPITAWSARLKGVPSIALSHQSCYYSAAVPRPEKRNRFLEKCIKYFAPVDDFIGFHFQRYESRIETPIIRADLRKIKPKNGPFNLVYLPGYGKAILQEYFSTFKYDQFIIYSKDVKKKIQQGNCTFLPIGISSWIEDFSNANAIIMGAGFEGPAEALYLGKRLICVPLSMQYEQKCNASALEKMGVPVIQKLNKNIKPLIENVLHSNPIQRYYPDNARSTCERVLEIAESLISKKSQYNNPLHSWDNNLSLTDMSI